MICSNDSGLDACGAAWAAAVAQESRVRRVAVAERYTGDFLIGAIKKDIQPFPP
jgi:hypothetical protein